MARSSFSDSTDLAKSEQFNPRGQSVDQILVSKTAPAGGFSFEWADNETGIETILESCAWGAWATDVLLAGITKKLELVTGVIILPQRQTAMHRPQPSMVAHEAME